jgi:hypothetical protein
MRAHVIVAAFIAAIGCASVAGRANAQTLAVKAGLNVSSITQNATFKPDDELLEGGGFMVGAQIRRSVNRLWQLQIEGLFTQKGNSLINGHEAPDLDDQIVINYIEVPVLARFSVFQRGRNTISIHGGPTFAFIASSTETNNGHPIFIPLKLKTFDMGLAIGGQVELKKLIIGGRYTIGLSDIFADDPAVYGFSEMKNRTFTLFAGYGLR